MLITGNPKYLLLRLKSRGQWQRKCTLSSASILHLEQSSDGTLFILYRYALSGDLFESILVILCRSEVEALSRVDLDSGL